MLGSQQIVAHDAQHKSMVERIFLNFMDVPYAEAPVSIWLWRPKGSTAAQSLMSTPITHAIWKIFASWPRLQHLGIPSLHSRTLSFQFPSISISWPHARIRGDTGCRFRGLGPWRCGWWTRRRVLVAFLFVSFRSSMFSSWELWEAYSGGVVHELNADLRHTSTGACCPSESSLLYLRSESHFQFIEFAGWRFVTYQCVRELKSCQ